MDFPCSNYTFLPANWLTIANQVHGLWNCYLQSASRHQQQLNGIEHLISLQQTCGFGDHLTEQADIVVKRILLATPQGPSIFEYKIAALSSPMIVYIGKALPPNTSPSQAQWVALRQKLEWWCIYNSEIMPGRVCYCIGAIGSYVRFWLYTTTVFAPQRVVYSQFATTTINGNISTSITTSTDAAATTAAASSASLAFDCQSTECFTTTWIFTAGTSEIIDIPNGDFDTELTLIGPTTLTWTAPTGTVFTEPFATTVPLTITIDSGYVDYLEDITGNVATVSGPTSVTTDVVQSGDMIYFINSIETETATFTQTVVEETQVLQIPVGTTYTLVTLVGPTDYIVTYTQAAYFATDPTPGVIAGGNTDDPQCNLTAGATLFSDDINRYITYAYQYVSLDAGQTTVTDSPLPITTATEEFGTYTELLYSPSHTFVGPTIFSLTTTQDLFNSLLVLFPTVSVLYFPVTSPNTACLSTTMAPGNMSASGIMVDARGLSGLSGDGSTLVNSNGFTFTSPSIYLVFPTISAVDACGLIGSIHTSTTIGFAPDDVSSVALVGGTTAFGVFDPADAQCPPLDATVPLYSIIGQTGYNPIISPPAGLTLLDPAWAGGCVIAEFQGNDPPFALIPQSNLSPTTSRPPGPINTPASPSSGIPAIPVQTNPPKTTTMFTPQSATAPLGASASSPPDAPPVASSSSLAANPPPSSATPTPHSTFTLPSDAAPLINPATALPAAPNDVSAVTAGVPPPSSASAAPPNSPPAILTLGGQTYTGTSGVYIIGSQTLAAGGKAARRLRSVWVGDHGDETRISHGACLDETPHRHVIPDMASQPGELPGAWKQYELEIHSFHLVSPGRDRLPAEERRQHPQPNIDKTQRELQNSQSALLWYLKRKLLQWQMTNA
ncbi:mucin 5B, oligomeric mucus gel-forming [Xylographa bjoerkii]|nr:mucin 5B, oligomeric mucus gel-forming [Xylographa bjoerkii]